MKNTSVQTNMIGKSVKIKTTMELWGEDLKPGNVRTSEQAVVYKRQDLVGEITAVFSKDGDLQIAVLFENGEIDQFYGFMIKVLNSQSK